MSVNRKVTVPRGRSCIGRRIGARQPRSGRAEPGPRGSEGHRPPQAHTGGPNPRSGRAMNVLDFGGCPVGQTSRRVDVPLPTHVRLSELPPDLAFAVPAQLQGLPPPFQLGPTVYPPQLMMLLGDASASVVLGSVGFDDGSDFGVQLDAGTAQVVFHPTAAGGRNDT